MTDPEALAIFDGKSLSYYVVWTDAERGPASHVVNLGDNTVNTAIAMDGVLMVLSGSVTGLE